MAIQRPTDDELLNLKVLATRLAKLAEVTNALPSIRYTFYMFLEGASLSLVRLAQVENENILKLEEEAVDYLATSVRALCQLVRDFEDGNHG